MVDGWIDWQTDWSTNGYLVISFLFAKITCCNSLVSWLTDWVIDSRFRPWRTKWPTRFACDNSTLLTAHEQAMKSTTFATPSTVHLARSFATPTLTQFFLNMKRRNWTMPLRTVAEAPHLEEPAQNARAPQFDQVPHHVPLPVLFEDHPLWDQRSDVPVRAQCLFDHRCVNDYWIQKISWGSRWSVQILIGWSLMISDYLTCRFNDFLCINYVEFNYAVNHVKGWWIC